MANLSDRYGRRPVYLGSVACFALGSLLIAVSPRFWMILPDVRFRALAPVASFRGERGDRRRGPPRAQGRALGLIGAV